MEAKRKIKELKLIQSYYMAPQHSAVWKTQINQNLTQLLLNSSRLICDESSVLRFLTTQMWMYKLAWVLFSSFAQACVIFIFSLQILEIKKSFVVHLNLLSARGHTSFKDVSLFLLKATAHLLIKESLVLFTHKRDYVLFKCWAKLLGFVRAQFKPKKFLLIKKWSAPFSPL